METARLIIITNSQVFKANKINYDIEDEMETTRDLSRLGYLHMQHRQFLLNIEKGTNWDKI
jgi:hypothetical protein